MSLKYWNYKKPRVTGPLKWDEIPGPRLPMRNSPEPFHTVHHREVGNIPGCVMAPREGIHRSEDLDTIQRKLHWRAERFLKANGVGNLMEKQHYFRGDHFNEELLGAYGEKL